MKKGIGMLLLFSVVLIAMSAVGYGAVPTCSGFSAVRTDDILKFEVYGLNDQDCGHGRVDFYLGAVPGGQFITNRVDCSGTCSASVSTSSSGIIQQDSWNVFYAYMMDCRPDGTYQGPALQCSGQRAVYIPEFNTIAIAILIGLIVAAAVFVKAKVLK